MIQDVKSHSVLSALYELRIMPRLKELAILMGNYKQVNIYEGSESHEFVKDVDGDWDDWNIVGPDYCYKCKHNKKTAPKVCRIRIGKHI